MISSRWDGKSATCGHCVRVSFAHGVQAAHGLPQLLVLALMLVLSFRSAAAGTRVQFDWFHVRFKYMG